MYLARFVLVGNSPPLQSEAELLGDTLWAHLSHGRGVEHITATATPAGIDLALFLSRDIADLDPVHYARLLLTEISPCSPLAQRWLQQL